MKLCCECLKSLPSNMFHKCVYHADGLQSKCKKCCLVYRKEYYQKYRSKALVDATNWQNRHLKKHNASSRKYKKTSAGKISAIKCLNKRERNFGFILMFPNPFTESALVDYHHVTNVYVVAIPRDLHRLYGGKFHREKVMDIVKQIYLKR